MFRRIFQRMAQMCPLAWEFFSRSLQLCCFLLFCSILLLKQSTGIGTEQFRQAAAFQECAQVALLMAAIIPVCLEDLTG